MSTTHVIGQISTGTRTNGALVQVVLDNHCNAALW